MSRIVSINSHMFPLLSIHIPLSKQTEIARRIAKLSQAPFIKVEATKFTEVGFHGKDVDQIIRDLVEVSITMTKKKLKEVRRCLVNLVCLVCFLPTCAV